VQVCGSIGLCPAGDRVQSRKLLATHSAAHGIGAAAQGGPLAELREDMGCTLCKMAVQYVEGALASNETLQQIIDAVSAQCAELKMPGPQTVDCGKVHAMPVITFNIAGKAFPLTPEQYILKVGACLPAPPPWSCLVKLSACLS
jgi:phytepsin